jgi:DNA-binding XRE family transcriptional regulator
MVKTKRPQHDNGPPTARRVRVKGKRMVMLDESAYEALLRRADLWEPALPAPDADGNYPALTALAVIQARDILRARRKAGLSQAELARRAGIRPETLNRIEQGRNKPSVPTIAKIDRALRTARMAEEHGGVETGGGRRPCQGGHGRA